MARRITVRNSENVDITVNDIEAYENHVRERVAEREKELREVFEARLNAADETKAAVSTKIETLQREIDALKTQ